ncbi:MAG: D-alanine--D-alanine ligase [Pseudohongiella sp.]|jgi:D-alanine-D-alanine ligase|nr:D-alanine--D-alanine ligase [Pseudohongiella sp.]
MRTINREIIVAKSGHVVVLKGGTSAEREISLLSGEAVFQGLQRLGVNSTVLDVTDDLVADLNRLSPDLVFIMLHGPGGEDGVTQGLLEAMKIPYTGSGVLASALAMDKIKTKLIWRQLGLKTADFLLLDAATDWQKVIADFGKVVVKPVNGGSSLGIAIVNDAESLQQQYKIASTFDSVVMAEKCIVGNEYSVGILQDQILPTVQLHTNRQFFDFDAKYVDEGTEIICPPDLSEVKQLELNELVRAAFESLGCKGLARVDVMQDENEEFYLLELNTIPGMTSHSFVPVAAKKSGIDFDELLLRILDVELALN